VIGSKILQTNVHVWGIPEINLNLVSLAGRVLVGKRSAIKAH
jgi:hypothetical protein